MVERIFIQSMQLYRLAYVGPKVGPRFEIYQILYDSLFYKVTCDLG